MTTGDKPKILSVNTEAALGDNPLRTNLNNGNAEEGQVEIDQRTINGASSQNETLRSVGRRLLPDGMEYEGSIAIHIYKKVELDGSYTLETRTQSCLDCPSPRAVSLALKAGSIAVAQKYGWEPAKKQSGLIKGR